MSDCYVNMEATKTFNSPSCGSRISPKGDILVYIAKLLDNDIQSIKPDKDSNRVFQFCKRVYNHTHRQVFIWVNGVF